MKTNLLQLPYSAEERELNRLYGHGGIESVRGAGLTSRPELMLMFMNPTARNTASNPKWSGLRAPWIGVNNTWRILARLNLISETGIPSTWNASSAEALYKHVAKQGLYITNLATCTQPDARHLPDSVFRQYLPHAYNEIETVNPKKIITFGNQVSSALLQRAVSVSQFQDTDFETLTIGGKEFRVYPTYYPVGQGQRNMPKAIKRIQAIQKL